jgi:hypothetical protein
MEYNSGEMRQSSSATLSVQGIGLSKQGGRKKNQYYRYFIFIYLVIINKIK